MRGMDTYTPDEIGPDGLTIAHEWVLVGCPVWRGYDLNRQLNHRERESAFIRHCDRLGLESDRCQCGGLAAWDEKDPRAATGDAPILAHYPPQFVEETHAREIEA